MITDLLSDPCPLIHHRYPAEIYNADGVRVFLEADSCDAWLLMHERIRQRILDPAKRERFFLLLLRLFSDKTQVCSLSFPSSFF
jgi:hypothetical protein